MFTQNMVAEKLASRIRQEQIAQAALQVIAANGFKGLNVAAVAERVGLVPSAIYRHFKGKEQIIDLILNLIRQRLLTTVETARSEADDPMATLHRILKGHVKLIRQNPAIPAVVFSENISGGNRERKKRMYGIIREYLGKVQEIIEEGQSQRNIRPDIKAETISVMFLGLIQPGAVLSHLGEGEFDITRHAARVWPIFVAGIRRE